jgi:hypothetical protein
MLLLVHVVAVTVRPNVLIFVNFAHALKGRRLVHVGPLRLPILLLERLCDPSVYVYVAEAADSLGGPAGEASGIVV